MDVPRHWRTGLPLSLRKMRVKWTDGQTVRLYHCHAYHVKHAHEQCESAHSQPGFKVLSYTYLDHSPDDDACGF